MFGGTSNALFETTSRGLVGPVWQANKEGSDLTGLGEVRIPGILGAVPIRRRGLRSTSEPRAYGDARTTDPNRGTPITTVHNIPRRRLCRGWSTGAQSPGPAGLWVTCGSVATRASLDWNQGCRLPSYVAPARALLAARDQGWAHSASPTFWMAAADGVYRGPGPLRRTLLELFADVRRLPQGLRCLGVIGRRRSTEITPLTLLPRQTPADRRYICQTSSGLGRERVGPTTIGRNPRAPAREWRTWWTS
jgi:hypothetical protein